MLKDFFRLDEPIETLSTHEEMLRHFESSGTDSLTNAKFMPEKIYREEGKVFSRKCFRNVSFSFTKFERVAFTGCQFEDCLFRHAEFIDCVFIDCDFKNCNLERVLISRCYLNPGSFCLDNSYKESAANIGTWMFQQLFMNAKNAHQPDFAGAAEIQFRRWLRAQQTYRHNKRLKELRWWNQLSLRMKHFFWLIKDVGFDMCVGYGHRPFKFVCFSLVGLILLGGLVHVFWEYFGLSLDSCPLIRGTYWTTLYYTTVVTTTLGFGDITPTTDIGRLSASALSLLGVIWFGLLAAVLIKRIIR